MNKNGSFIQSFKHACSGVLTIWKEERNIKIESVIGCLALIGCAIFRVSKGEWLAVIFCCMVVLSLECMNSAVENAVDYAGEEIHPLAKRAKDFAAGAVLIAAVFACIIGIIIFVPKIIIGK